MARVTKPLTDTEINRLKTKEKDIKLYDGNGLFLLAKANNGSKLWRFKYRIPKDKKENTLSLFDPSTKKST